MELFPYLIFLDLDKMDIYRDKFLKSIREDLYFRFWSDFFLRNWLGTPDSTTKRAVDRLFTPPTRREASSPPGTQQGDFDI